MLAIGLLLESQERMMCCEMQRECSGRATLPGGVVWLERLSTTGYAQALEACQARDRFETVKVHRGSLSSLGSRQQQRRQQQQ